METILEQEWIDLIWEAKTLGLSVEEVRAFLKGDCTHVDMKVGNGTSWKEGHSI